MIRSHRGLLSVAMNMSKLRCVSSGFTNEILNSYDFFRGFYQHSDRIVTDII